MYLLKMFNHIIYKSVYSIVITFQAHFSSHAGHKLSQKIMEKFFATVLYKLTDILKLTIREITFCWQRRWKKEYRFRVMFIEIRDIIKYSVETVLDRMRIRNSLFGDDLSSVMLSVCEKLCFCFPKEFGNNIFFR